MESLRQHDVIFSCTCLLSWTVALHHYTCQSFCSGSQVTDHDKRRRVILAVFQHQQDSSPSLYFYYLGPAGPLVNSLQLIGLPSQSTISWAALASTSLHIALYYLEHNHSILFACIRGFAITLDLVHTQNYMANWCMYTNPIRVCCNNYKECFSIYMIL